MRPRVFPAEDHQPVSLRQRDARRFNEAAGIPRGRQQDATRPAARRCSFNEAAGIPRGRRPTPGTAGHAGERFNEAAGIPRGRLQVRVPPGRSGAASMRPRVFPAEDLLISNSCQVL